jgi:membrane fusion protein, multidrug efflux system
MVRQAVFAALAAVILVACDKQEQQPVRSGPPATLITVAKAEVVKLEIAEETVGTLENTVDPRVGAEIAGRVVQVNAEPGKFVKRGQLLAEIDSSDQEIQGRADSAEISRLEILLANQERIVERQSELVKQNFISRTALDDSTAQRNALRQQLAAARAKHDAGRNALRKTRVLSPIEGRIEQRMVNQGDFVKVGDPLFRIVGTQVLRASLPFPESASNRIKVGLPVKLSSPLAPGKVIDAKVTELRPTITATSRALNAIVQFTTDGSFVGGGTVNAKVITATKDNVVVVPEQSVVLRPAGKVVYLVNEGKAQQKVVETGYRRDGKVEIVSGLSGGETLALDGAGFLTHNASVTLPQPRAAKAGAGKGGRERGATEEGKDKSGEGPGTPRPAADKGALQPGLSRI